MPLPNKQVCPTEEQLIDFLGSDGHSGEQASLASHVAECALCADAVQRLLSGEREEDQPTFEQRPDGRVAQADIETSRPETSVEMSPAPPSPHGAPSLSDPAELSVTERYVKLRLHDRGGLGEVFVAEDCELHRQVALKQIQEKFAENAESRERFVREAEVTGGLEHPGIVPVYGLGQYPDGRPYYAMRFIRGDTLKSLVDDYHEQSFPRSSTDGTLQF